MTLIEIKQAIDKGDSVYWSHEAYEVLKNNNGWYYVKCNRNNYITGLTWRDGVTMNGKESDFFTNSEDKR
tara:strand:+ start:326 stop:535 length:210 start_codon:yes stop_codon:yes gene_type:complete